MISIHRQVSPTTRSAILTLGVLFGALLAGLVIGAERYGLLLAIAGVVCLVVLVLAPMKWSVALAAISFFFGTGVLRPPIGTYSIILASDIAGLALVISLLAKFVLLDEESRRRIFVKIGSLPLLRPLIAMLIVYGLSLLVNFQRSYGTLYNAGPALVDWIRLCLYISIFVIAFISVSSESSLKILKLILVCTLFVGTYGIVVDQILDLSRTYIAQDGSVGTRYSYGITSTLSANYLAAGTFLLIPTFLAASMIFAPSRHSSNRLLYAVVFLIAVYVLAMTLARGAWVGAVGGMLVFAWLRLRTKKSILLTVFLLVAVGVLAIKILPGVPDISFRISTLGINDEGRFVRWYSSWNVFRSNVSNWPLGVGPRRIVLYAIGDSHNNFLQFLTEQGVAGFLVFLWFLSATFKFLVSRLGLEINSVQHELVIGGLAAFLALVITAFFQETFLPQVGFGGLLGFLLLYLALIDKATASEGLVIDRAKV